MTSFSLDTQLENDSFFVRDLTLSQVRLNNQQAIPWLILVPRRFNIREIYELNNSDAAQLMNEISLVSRALIDLYSPDKINIGALGNLVPQLHIHVIGRFTKDEAWPSAVWGNITPKLYTSVKAQQIIENLNALDLWTTH